MRTIVLALAAVGALAQAPPPAALDLSAIGPKVGDRVPDFTGVDQFGRTHALASSLGEKGAMLVFFRSADW
jgi:hypothetical protein